MARVLKGFHSFTCTPTRVQVCTSVTHVINSWSPYFTSREDVLPPSAEASNGPDAHPQINHKVTKSQSVALTSVHTKIGTIPLQLRVPTWAYHPLLCTFDISKRTPSLRARQPWSQWPANLARKIQETYHRKLSWPCCELLSSCSQVLPSAQ